MSSSSPPPPPPTPQQANDPPTPTTTNPLFHYAALGAIVLCPLALLAPSRSGRGKTLLQNAVLSAGSFWALDTLAAEYTGKSVSARSGERWAALFGMDSQKKEGVGGGKGGWLSGGGLPTEKAERNRVLMEEERRRRAEREGREYKERDRRGLWERVWMGGEREGWKEKRVEEERRALESGKGYGELISEQIKEVWEGSGKKGGGEGGKKE